MTEAKKSTRAEVIILVCNLTFGRGFHFCSIEKLQGTDADLWFPLADPARLFEAVESVMQMNGIAHNVTGLDVIAEYPTCKDVRVRYNAA
ncbi:hypothetical protein ACA373_21440 [Erwinia sp. STN24]|uniref:hypothetical protein n=1 Tax=Erwinia sp. STN24 TaxID=3233996 RepID=UPI003522CA9C